MTKDVNETVKHKPDPERSAAAKGRKPPPNWAAKYREAQARVADLEDSIPGLIRDRDTAIAERNASLRREARSSAIIRTLTALRMTEKELAAQQLRPWWAKRKDDIAALAKHASGLQERLTRIVREGEMPHGNVAGLAQMPAAAGQDAALQNPAAADVQSASNRPYHSR